LVVEAMRSVNTP